MLFKTEMGSLMARLVLGLPALKYWIIKDVVKLFTVFVAYGCHLLMDVAVSRAEQGLGWEITQMLCCITYQVNPGDYFSYLGSSFQQSQTHIEISPHSCSPSQ